MTQSNDNSIESLFSPRSIALAGIPITDPSQWTRIFWTGLIEFGFQGPLYPVNPKGQEIDGHKVYKDLEDIPGNVDYVISTVSAQTGPDLLRACAKKGVKAVQFCTAGFSEIADDRGAELEKELVRLGHEYGIRILGPNCLGIYCPESKMAFRPDFPKKTGPVGLVCQSGGNSAQIILESKWRGVRFSKAVSYGNACDLCESDFLEYFADDSKTEVIGLYIEGVKDGQRFRQAIEKVTRTKTVVLLKGGVTRGGARATGSHTGAMAGDEAIWDGFCEQFGIIRVHSIGEMVDVFVTCLFMPVSGGRSTAIIGAGGGASVSITDEFEKRNLIVPALPENIISEIMEFTPAAGNMLQNPLDYGQSMMELDKLRKMVGIVTNWDGIDFITFFLIANFFREGEQQLLFDFLKVFNDVGKKLLKPIAFVFIPDIVQGEGVDLALVLQKIQVIKLPVYFSFHTAANAIDLYLRHCEKKRLREA